VTRLSQKVDPHEANDTVKAPKIEFRPMLRDINVPPIFEAAIPVLAVTETTAGFFVCFFLREAIIARSKSDFPVPVQPKTRD
jgi:hypothetical protein